MDKKIFNMPCSTFLRVMSFIYQKVYYIQKNQTQIFKGKRLKVTMHNFWLQNVFSIT